MGLFGIFSKEKKESLDKGLEKTKDGFFSKLGRVVAGKSKVDDEILDELEEILITSDVGVETTIKIIQRIEERVAKDKYLNTTELDRILREEIAELLSENNSEDLTDFTIPAGHKPHVILVVGVNGVGKTTTIGKLAAQFKSKGKSVVLGAVEMGADLMIVDTAGRLHTKVNLMNELTKIKRVMQKFIPEAPHEILLVLDGSTGQNAFIQAKEFTKATEVSALAITKLDGTAKGGVVIGISDQFKIPVKYIGVGEQVGDLQVFNKAEFVDSLFKK